MKKTKKKNCLVRFADFYKYIVPNKRYMFFFLWLFAESEKSSSLKSFDSEYIAETT